VYSATVSNSDKCQVNDGPGTGIDVCAYNLTGGEGGTQVYNGSLNSTLNSVIPISTTDNLQTPGSGTASLTETINSMSAMGTFTDTVYPVAGCVSSGTESFTGGPTQSGTFNVNSLAMATDQSGNVTDFTLDVQTTPTIELAVPGDVTNWTSTQFPGPNCVIGPQPQPPGSAGFAEASRDAAVVDASLGFQNSQGGFTYTGWTIDPNHDWTPQNGGVLAEKTITGTTQFPAPDVGPINSAETIQVVTGPCLPPPGAFVSTSATRAAGQSDSVAFAPVRNDDTPVGMPDRIPPRPKHETNVNISVNLASCSSAKVKITAQGTVGDGEVLINGMKAFTLPRRGTYSVTLSIRGVAMTDEGRGPHLVLVAKEISPSGGTQTIGQSNPFVVSAIPRKFSDKLVGPVDGAQRGMIVQDSWKSDSGDPMDLNGTIMSELVQHLNGDLGKVSGFLPGNFFGVDTHAIGVNRIPQTEGVFAVSDQAECFVDLRSFPPTDHVHPDPADIFPMTNSGYTITRSVQADPDGLGLDALTVTTSKVGASVTVGVELEWANASLSVSSGPGATDPAPGIFVTQDLGSGNVE
jgi:hypothetical protein